MEGKIVRLYKNFPTLEMSIEYGDIFHHYLHICIYDPDGNMLKDSWIEDIGSVTQRDYRSVALKTSSDTLYFIYHESQDYPPLAYLDLSKNEIRGLLHYGDAYVENELIRMYFKARKQEQ